METTDESNPTPSSLFQLLAAGHFLVAGMVIYLGGFALHVWTAYLFFTNWGTFWAIVAFCVPVMAEVAAIPLVCFWWGPWFYILAIASYLAALLPFGFLSSAEEKSVRLFLGIAAIAMYASLGGLSFFAVRAANLPKPLSENDRREIEDVSCAVCGVLKNCSSSDSAVIAGLAEEKDRLRRRIGEYDAMRREEINRKVNIYLRTFALTEQDSMAYVFDPQVSERPFSLSAEAREAMELLPERMRSTDSELEIAAKELRRQTSTAIAERVSRADLDKVLKLAQQREWQLMGEVYKDLLGSPMPGREELIGRSSSSGHQEHP
jgi:hypothetical protein